MSPKEFAEINPLRPHMFYSYEDYWNAVKELWRIYNE